MPIYAGTEGRAGGVYNELLFRKQVAEDLGYETSLFNQWDSIKEHCPDSTIFHVFMANNSMLDLTFKLKEYGFKIVLSPIFDTRWGKLKVSFFVSLLYHSRVMHAHLKSGRIICEMSDAICTRSSQESDIVASSFHISRTKIHRILNLPKKHLNSECDIDYKQNIVFFLGNWGTERKNVKRLLRAVLDLNLNLIIAGSASNGPLKQEIIALAKQSPNISIKGFLSSDEVAEIYTKAKVFAMPSLFEGTGLAALDALSYGTNVLITSRGGVRDYFDENAFFVDPLSVESIKKQLKLAMVSDFSPLSSTYLDKFRYKDVLHQTEDMYELL